MTPLPPLARRADEDPDPPAPPDLGAPPPPLARRAVENSDPPAPSDLGEARKILSAPFWGLYRSVLVGLMLFVLAGLVITISGFTFLLNDIRTIYGDGGFVVRTGVFLLAMGSVLYGLPFFFASKAGRPDHRKSGFAACALALGSTALLPIFPVSWAMIYFAIRGLKALNHPIVLDARDSLAELNPKPPLSNDEAAAQRAVQVPAWGFIACGLLSILLGLIGTFAFAAAAEAALARRSFLDFSGYFLYVCAAYTFIAAVLLMIPIVFCGFRLKKGQGTGAGYTAAGFSIAALILLPVSPAAWGLMASAIWTFVALSKRDLRNRRRYLPDEDDL